MKKIILLSMMIFSSGAMAKNFLVLRMSSDGILPSIKTEYAEDDKEMGFVSKDGVFLCPTSYQKDDKKFVFSCTADDGKTIFRVFVKCDNSGVVSTMLVSEKRTFQVMAECEKRKAK